MILQGRVTVNGEVITELGSKADLETDHIKVDGTLLKAPRTHVYIALHKPRECVTTVSDPEGRQTVMHLLRGVKERVFPVGRLDYSSEGLLLLTNDGEFAHRITAPASHVVKTYVVKVNGNLTDEQVTAFANGIPLHGRRTAPAHIKLIKTGENPWYEVRLSEGRQNQIRMMFKHFGKLVEKLRRVKIGFLELDLAPGRYRTLTASEIQKFRHILKLDQPAEKAEKKDAAEPDAETEAVVAKVRPARSAKPALLIRRPRRLAPPPASESNEAPEESAPSRPTRSDRPSRPTGPSRFGSPSRGDRPSRPSGPPRFDRGDRPSGPPRGDRPDRASGPPRGDRPSRPSGPPRFDRGDRPSGPPRGDRPDRASGPPRGDRPSRPSGPPRFDRGDRPSGPPRGDRPDRASGPPRSDRPSRPSGPPRFDRGDRPSGPPRGDRPDRASGPPRGDRPSRPSGPPRFDRGDRPSGPPRGDRPSRPSGPPRGDRPERSSGPSRSGGPKRPSGPSRGGPPRGKPRA